MKKISYYLIFVVIIGGVLVSFWMYQKYFKEEEPNLLLFKVEKGSIQEVVKVRGEVVPQKDFDLEFPLSGIVERVFVKEGQQVKQNDPLMKLETTDFELEIQTLTAQSAQAGANIKSQQAKLDDLLRDGPAPKQVSSEYINVKDIINDAYAKAENAIRVQTATIFNGSADSGYSLALSGCPSNAQGNVGDMLAKRRDIEYELIAWKQKIDAMSQNASPSVLDTALRDASAHLLSFRSFLYQANGVITTCPGTSAPFAAALASLNTGISTINTAITNVQNKEQSIISQGYSISAQEAEVEKAQANAQSVQAQIAIIQENIKKSTLYAPGAAKITKVWFERQEFFRPGQTAVSLSISGHKIQTDISELEIGKVREVDGNEVLVQLDAFPDLNLNGKIFSIEPREIIKEGDKYYRANIYIEPHGADIRSGMNADLTILISSKGDVLKIPELAVYQRDSKKFVTILEGGQRKEVEIETGISDGESIEVMKGLSEGQTIAVSAD